MAVENKLTLALAKLYPKGQLYPKGLDPAPSNGVYPEHRSGQAQLRVLGQGTRELPSSDREQEMGNREKNV